MEIPINRNICSIINKYLPEISYFIVKGEHSFAQFKTIKEIDDYIYEYIIDLYGDNEKLYRSDIDYSNYQSGLCKLYNIDIDKFLTGFVYKFKIGYYTDIMYQYKITETIEIKIQGYRCKL
jgi:hypothetical protein